MNNTQLFSIIGILLIAAETVVPGFIALPIGVGFLIAAGASLYITSIPAQLVALGIGILVSYIFFWKWVKPRSKKTKVTTNVDSLIGKTGTVEEEINSQNKTGYVKIYGDHWMAISTEIIEKGTNVKVTRVDGNKVHVVRA